MSDVKEVGAFWEDRSVMVTGATGLVGSWLVQQLLSEGAHVVCLVRDVVPEARLYTLAKERRPVVVGGDVRDQSIMERVMGEYEVTTIFHLAAQTVVEIANRNPGETLDTNIRGTWTVLEAARRSSTVRQVIVASSDKAYGDTNGTSAENARLEGRHPYDVSKSCADLIAQAFARTYDMPIAIARCGNLFGGGDLNWSRLVPGTIRSVLKGKAPVIRSDGTLVRDYVYVEDGVSGYLALARGLEQTPALAGEAFNFSYTDHRTVQEMVQAIISMMESELAPVVLNQANNEINFQSLDAAKARSVLRWEPAWTIERGLGVTIAWYEQYFKTHGLDALPEQEALDA